MGLTIHELHDILDVVILEFLESNDDLFDIWPKEECFNHQFAVLLERKLNVVVPNNDWVIDLEYDRQGRDGKSKVIDCPIRPDIILHKRGTDSCNFLAIECKKRCFHSSDLDKLDKLMLKFDYSFVCMVVFIRDQMGNPSIRYRLKGDSSVSLKSCEIISSCDSRLSNSF